MIKLMMAVYIALDHLVNWLTGARDSVDDQIAKLENEK